MTPRQQEARDLRAQGLTQTKIGELMGIGQRRVSALLSLNRGRKEADARYRKTERGRAKNRELSRRWAKANRNKVNAMARLYYAANPEKFREKQAKYFRTEKGREIHRKASLKYYYANHEKALLQNAAYQKSPSGRAAHNRAARKWAAKRLGQKVLDFQGATP